MDHLCYFCIMFVMLSRLLIAALWSPARKGLKLVSLRMLNYGNYLKIYLFMSFTTSRDIVGRLFYHDKRKYWSV